MRNNWIFQLVNPLTDSQKDFLQTRISAFLDKWKTHGKPVAGKFEIRYDRFMLIEAEAGATSGCSIDSMTREVSAALSECDAAKAESNFIFYRNAAGEIAFVDFREVEKQIEAGSLSADTLIFDNTLGHSNDWSRWELPLKSTWLSRFLPVTQN